jgi:MFS family permease
MRKTGAGNWILRKVPFGIIAGASAIVVFYAVFGFVAAYILFSNIAKQTSETVSPFQHGWQGLIFAAIIIFSVIFLAALIMFILKKTLFKKRLALTASPAEETAGANETAVSVTDETVTAASLETDAPEAADGPASSGGGEGSAND